MTKSGDIEGYSHSDHQEVTIDARERQQQRVFIILPEQPQSSDGMTSDVVGMRSQQIN